MYAITIFHSVQEIESFSFFFFFFFRIWSSAKPRLMKNDISQSLGLDLDNINVCLKVYQNIPLSSRDMTIFTFSELEPRRRPRHYHFFRIWSSAKPRPMKNIILQSLVLDLINIYVYATVYQNIPLSLRDRAIF